jgi:hypothetical protein
MFSVTTEQDLQKLLALPQLPTDIDLQDHLDGFDHNYRNEFFDRIHDRAVADNVKIVLRSTNFLPARVHAEYPNFDIKFWLNSFQRANLGEFVDYPECDPVKYKNFICSFNGIGHVSRQLLTAGLAQRGLFDPASCSKNFKFTTNTLDGHLRHLAGDNERLLRKFFIYQGSEDFFQTVYSFGHNRFQHGLNLRKLEGVLTTSFLNVVSESVATSYAPFVTEKFLYSVVTRGLFVAYAQPGWHRDLERYYGIKPYSRIFDYGFDAIENPVRRLVELISMIAKFQKLNAADWTDLYDMERDTIEYNYDHHRSGNFFKMLENASYTS